METRLKAPQIRARDLFTAVCLVTSPLNESEAGGDLVMIETSLLLLCKFLIINIRKAGRFLSRLSSIQRPGNTTVKMVYWTKMCLFFIITMMTVSRKKVVVYSNLDK